MMIRIFLTFLAFAKRGVGIRTFFADFIYFLKGSEQAYDDYYQEVIDISFSHSYNAIFQIEVTQPVRV